MKQLFLKTASFFTLYGCLSVNVAHGQSQHAQLQRLFENYYQETLRLDPITATFTGYHEYDNQLAMMDLLLI
ncbi:hypothetical protein [Chitinophaga pinensis]|uniref:DUF885 domain-containing protein n=1 Tax=Chitinophaga pinensis TaxID=79329 RepID=A0A5C6M075_9BACT|nr:hypothetical protein [Chitinophaga pinensis]TWW02394.1 hypothetical protein FEF09_00880 [Chitinophaga pinensis]